MPQDSHRRKQEILKRAAQSRLDVIDSCGDVRRAAASCAGVLPVSARYLKIGALVAGGAVGTGLLLRLLPRARRKSAAVAVSFTSRVTRLLISELLAGLALPLCRQYFFGLQTADTPIRLPRAVEWAWRFLRRRCRAFGPFPPPSLFSPCLSLSASYNLASYL